MDDVTIIKHSLGAIGLRVLGFGPSLLPCKALKQLQNLLDENTSWAKQRSLREIKKTLCNSDSIVSVWRNNKIIGFGRASSDHVFRATLWDVVIKKDEQRNGLGKIIVTNLLKSKCLKNVEKIYLMTSLGANFYEQLGFNSNTKQTLMVINKSRYE